jgi:hypothetical protein
MYDAVLRPKRRKGTVNQFQQAQSGKDMINLKHIPFGDKRYSNYRDKTGLNLYPNLIHNDKERRKRFRARHLKFLKKGFYSPSYFSYYVLW